MTSPANSIVTCWVIKSKVVASVGAAVGDAAQVPAHTVVTAGIAHTSLIAPPVLATSSAIIKAQSERASPAGVGGDVVEAQVPAHTLRIGSLVPVIQQ